MEGKERKGLSANEEKKMEATDVRVEKRIGRKMEKEESAGGRREIGYRVGEGRLCATQVNAPRQASNPLRTPYRPPAEASTHGTHDTGSSHLLSYLQSAPRRESAHEKAENPN